MFWCRYWALDQAHQNLAFPPSGYDRTLADRIVTVQYHSIADLRIESTRGENAGSTAAGQLPDAFVGQSISLVSLCQQGLDYLGERGAGLRILQKSGGFNACFPHHVARQVQPPGARIFANIAARCHL